MQKDSASLPWKYEKFSSLMASVREDLHLYADSNMIKDDRYIKVVMKCNEKLGERIHQSKTCKIKVENYEAPVPEDMWKIENIFGISIAKVSQQQLTGIFGATQLVFHKADEQPEPTGSERIKLLGSCNIADDECNLVVSKIDRNFIEMTENKAAFPLILSPRIDKECVAYSPCKQWSGQYQVDLQNDTFKFSFNEGEIVLTYLGALTDYEGEILYPFHSLLNDYYEYSIKKKILEDLLLNSDADVSQKLQYVEAKLSEAYYDAFTFIQSAKANQYSKIRKRYEMDFYKKWYSAFE